MVEIITTLLKPFITKGAKIAWENREHLKTYYKTKVGKFKNVNVRFSISYLFRIQIPNKNKYLLVLNRRITNQLQPVGGVYKRYGDNSLFNKWGYKPDNSINGLNTDEKSESDLRLMVQGKYVLEVLNWFESKSERVTPPDREFREELLDTKILSSKVFNQIKYKHIRRFSKNLIWSDFFKCYEVLLYVVFDLIPDEKQKLALIKLSKQKNNLEKGFVIVSCDDIEQLRLVEKDKQIARIGHHTKLIINQKF